MEKKKLSPLKAIRLKCLDCMCGNAAEVRRCPCEDCTLYPFRFGKNPNREGIGSKQPFKPSSTYST